MWKGHQRLIIGIGGSMDQELVDAYAAKNACCAEGFGEYERMSCRSN